MTHFGGKRTSWGRALLAGLSFILMLGACSNNNAASRGNTGSKGSGSSQTSASRGSEEPTPTSSSPEALPGVALAKVAQLGPLSAMATRPNDPNIYLAEKTGRVRVLREGKVDSEPVVDLSDQVSLGYEQGLLGLALDPDDPKLYVNYTDKTGDTVISEFPFSNPPKPVAKGPGRRLMKVDQPYENHNGGQLAFGPDGYLYIGLGDGGSSGDPHGNAQNLNSLLGKILRIEPKATGASLYTVPPDNPFAKRADARSEIWAYGLRNPWRFSFDKLTGDLWIGDVGQNKREEIDFAPASSNGGENYGWNVREGTTDFKKGTKGDFTEPIHDYTHDDGGCSVIGGFVYRGKALPGLAGRYVLADFCKGDLLSLTRSGSEVHVQSLELHVDQLSSFGEDQSGELYALDLNGELLRIIAR